MVQTKPRMLTRNKQKNADKYIRALRLPFITASVIPFLAGTLLQVKTIDYFKFILGLIAVVATHLGSNLINDYSDSKSGADWQDKRFYGFFGGSKLIQENVFSERFYLKGARLFFAIACLAVTGLSVFALSVKTLGFFLLILFLGITYSYAPVKFSYRYLGEFVVFVLFGPAIVMGAYFIQTDIFPTLNGFLLSLPFAFFISAILIANEVPDFQGDVKSGKFNLISVTGINKAYLLYYGIMGLGLLSVAANILIHTLSFISLTTFLFIPLIFKSGLLLKNNYKDKLKLVDSSKFTIAVQTGIGLIIVLDLWLKR
ncbi:MAG: prenyltransferase [Candidatus Omnitrophota bacterium]